MLLTQQHAVLDTSSNFALHMHHRKIGSSNLPHNFNRKFKPTQFQKPRPGPSFQRHSAGGSSFQKNPASNFTPQSFKTSPSTRAPCQICGKTSHTALDCFHMMDYAYQGRHPPAQLSAMMAHMNNTFEEQEWLADSGANTHVTNELDNLAIQQPFQGRESVTVGNGASLAIETIGLSILKPSDSSYTSVFLLDNIQHCPKASTNLLSIQKFCHDSHCYFKLTSTHFIVKDIQTRRILLAGRSENGLYPLRFLRASLATNKCSFTAGLGIRTTLSIWHFRLGHTSHVTVSHVLKNYHLPVASDVSNKSLFCDSCQLGKSKKLPFQASTRKSNQPLELIHTDLWTSHVPSISGCRYYVIFVDDFSRYTWFYPLSAKSAIFPTFVKFKTLVENQFSSPIKKLQSDRGGEYNSLQFQAFLSHHGILHRKSCPHTSQQNRVAERKLRHILETSLIMLAHSRLSYQYWVVSFLTAVYIINRLPTAILQQSSPYEKLFHKSPEYTRLKVFGCKCFPLLRPYNTNKLEYRSKPCIILGYSNAGYCCLDLFTNRVYLSRHVVFDELSFLAKEVAISRLPSKINASVDAPFLIPVSSPISHSHSDFHISNDTPSMSSPNPDATITTPLSQPPPTSSSAAPIPTIPAPSSIQPTSTTEHSSVSLPTTTFGIPSPSILEPPAASFPAPTSASPPPPLSPIQPVSPLASPPASLPSSPPLPLTVSHPLPPPHPMLTRSRIGSHRPKQFPDFHLYYTSKHPPSPLSTPFHLKEPTSFTKAATDSRWQLAMQQEFSALISNGTWSLCPRPYHTNIIRNKWVYKIKRKADGSLDRFNARLVAKGFEQQRGIDYTDTFSLVIKSSTIRIVLALVVHFNWPLKQLDVSNGFLHGTLQEEVYMEQPQGFKDPLHLTYVCKLHKAIYGLMVSLPILLPTETWIHCIFGGYFSLCLPTWDSSDLPSCLCRRHYHHWF
jgi:transposase InsO family protein